MGTKRKGAGAGEGLGTAQEETGGRLFSVNFWCFRWVHFKHIRIVLLYTWNTSFTELGISQIQVIEKDMNPNSSVTEHTKIGARVSKSYHFII